MKQLDSDQKLKKQKRGGLSGNAATDNKPMSKIQQGDRGAQYPKNKQPDLKMGGRPK